MQSVEKHGTLTFHENVQTEGHHMISPLEQTYYSGGTSDVPLADFLARPVLIQDYAWGAGSNFDFTFKPWDDFVQDPEIRRRIEKFRYLRGHLKLRFVVTGNPFLFGRMLAAYEPMADRSVFSDYGSAFGQPSRMCHSQMPHVYLDASTSEGGEMTLPFFTPYNWIDLARGEATQEMGTLKLLNMTPLQHSLGKSSAMRIAVYAWMEDAEIVTPTASNYDTVTYQNALGSQDEHNTGLISKPASAVAKAAGWLSRFPVLRPYALATEVAASTIGNIAHIFGFSRPNVITNITPYRELAMGELAVTNTHEVIPKLAMDGKNQLTVDSRTVGLSGEDEMNIKSIVTRESYLEQGFWSPANARGKIIMSIGVSPYYVGVNSATTPFRNSMPPCTGVGMLFNYWRGSMTYRVSVVAAAHHRGKLLVQYDPLQSGVTNPNMVYSQVIDISEKRDFEFTVHWHAPTSWLRRHAVTFGDFVDLGYKEGSAYPTEPFSHNGAVTISVLNPLNVPDDTLAQSISVVCFVKGGDDLEFAEPADPPLPFSYRSSNALIMPQNALDDPDDPVHPLGGEPIDDMGSDPIPAADHSNLVFFGEVISSIRSFLRRYQYHSIVTAGVPGDSNVISGVRVPVTTSGMYNREYIIPWYVGWRGSHRFRLLPQLVDKTYVMAAAHNATSKNMRGFAAIQANNGTVEVDLPYYCNKRFSMCRTAPGWTFATDVNPWSPNGQGVSVYNTGASAVAGNHLYYASGEDYSLFFFLCIPPVFKN